MRYIISLILIFLTNNLLFSQEITLPSKVGNFTNASSISINPTGYLFVSDVSSNEVYKLDTLGNELKSIGGYGWDEYSFDEPIDVFATTLNVYVCDKNNDRVQIFDKDLNFLTNFNTNNIDNPDLAFAYPICSGISSQGDIYVLDSDNQRILKYNLSGELLHEIGSYEAGAFMLSNPTQFIVTPNNNLFVLDGKQIFVFDQFGMGIQKINLDFEPLSINIIFTDLVITSNSAIYYHNFSNPQFSLKKIYTAKNSDDHILDAVKFNQKLYILFEDHIEIYQITR